MRYRHPVRICWGQVLRRGPARHVRDAFIEGCELVLGGQGACHEVRLAIVDDVAAPDNPSIVQCLPCGSERSRGRMPFRHGPPGCFPVAGDRLLELFDGLPFGLMTVEEGRRHAEEPAA